MIFVTGGTGLLGNCIVRELCSRKIPTRVLCRQGTPRAAFEGPDVEIVAGDLDRREVLNSAISMGDLTHWNEKLDGNATDRKV